MFAWFQRLLPRRGDFFGLFEAHAATLVGAAEALEQLAEVLAEDDLEHLLLRVEVVVEQAVRDTRFLGDVAHARPVVAGAGEHADGRVEQQPALVLDGD